MGSSATKSPASSVLDLALLHSSECKWKYSSWSWIMLGLGESSIYSQEETSKKNYGSTHLKTQWIFLVLTNRMHAHLSMTGANPTPGKIKQAVTNTAIVYIHSLMTMLTIGFCILSAASRKQFCCQKKMKTLFISVPSKYSLYPITMQSLLLICLQKGREKHSYEYVFRSSLFKQI